MTFVAPVYTVRVYAFGGSLGFGSLLADFTNPKNIGYTDNLNDVPEAFVTINQDDPGLTAVRGYEGRSHIRILRDNQIVWSGWFGMEVDSNGRDVIFTCYGYLAGLYFLHSDWNVAYTSATVGTIVSDLWTRAKTTLTSSPLAFVTTGTLEVPVTTSGGGVSLTLPTYTMFYKRILFAVREMAALSASDTTNSVVFEISLGETAPTFNFWKARTATRPDVVWEYGDGLVTDFRNYTLPIYRRNNMLAVGSDPNNASLRYEYTNAADFTNYGRRQESLYFSYARDATELTRITSLRAALAIRDSPDLSISFAPNAVKPPLSHDTTFAGFRLGDKVRVKVNRGMTNLDQYFLAVGYKVLVLRGNEHVRITLQDPSGS